MTEKGFIRYNFYDDYQTTTTDYYVIYNKYMKMNLSISLKYIVDSFTIHNQNYLNNNKFIIIFILIRQKRKCFT